MKVYDQLRISLDDSYHVFYSRPWLGLDRLGNERDGECDFVVAHPDTGLLAIEVKGGAISYHPQEDQWKSTDRKGFTHKIKDPVEQARSSKYQIIRKLRSARGMEHVFVGASHGVIFPDVGSLNVDLGMDRPKELFCCQDQLFGSLGEWIASRMQRNGRGAERDGLGAAGISALTQLLAAPFALSFKIGGSLAEAEQGFRNLEPQQYQILDQIEGIPRALVSGGAGTGKTVLAMEQAVRSSKAGRRTLLVCHGRPLSNHLATTLAGHANLEVRSFHSFCSRMASVANIELRDGLLQSELFSKVLPEALCDAMELRPDLRLESIIVDEGQDFMQEWWIAIDSALLDSAKLTVFMDSNQKVYDTSASVVQDLAPVPIRLTTNLRNTKRIHTASAVHYDGPEVRAVGPDGLEVTWIEVNDRKDLSRMAMKELRRMIHREDVSPNDIAILVNSAEVKNQFLAKASGVNVTFTDAERSSEDSVIVDTVRRFKGLERAAVIVLMEGDDMESRELAYVAFSRARSYLCVVADSADMNWLSVP